MSKNLEISRKAVKGMIDKIVDTDTLTEIQKLEILKDVSSLLRVRVTTDEHAKSFSDTVMSMSD